MAQSRRVFVGNLPHDITKDAIVSKFKEYGTVETVEIKSKKDPTSGENTATFSFINLHTDEESIHNCVYSLNGLKLGGRKIKVESAKESFLQRLQRERESGQKSVAPQPFSATAPPKKSEKVFNEAVKESKPAQIKPASKIRFGSPDSSDNEDAKKKYNSPTKLPKFKGIGSFVSHESIIVTKNKDSPVSKAFFGNNDRLSRKSHPKAQYNSETSDILKKFESFSDVWKDDDEPSPQHARLGAETHKFKEAPKPASSNIAEEKRLKSMEAKREAFEQQKRAVKLALSDKSAPQMNKKIVFDDNEESADKQQKPQKLKKVVRKEKQKALTLFDNSDDEPESDWKNAFQVRKQFEGAQGKKLLELQSRFNNDQRFKLDERFYDNSEEIKSKTSATSEPKQQPKSQHSDDDVVEGVEDLAEEREQQFQILSSILGQPVPATLPQTHHESKNRGMLRFDPSKPNHMKYELTKEPKEKKKKLKAGVPSDPDGEAEEGETGSRKIQREEKDPEPVSQSKFYSVSDSLADSLRLSKEGQSSGFSLLQLFGPSNTPSEEKKKNIGVHVKELSKKEGAKKRPILQDFSSEEEDEVPIAAPLEAPEATTTAAPGIVSSHGVWQQSFFLQPDDSRLSEAASFFTQTNKRYDENYAQRRTQLKKFISRKWHDDWNSEAKQKGRSFQKRVSSKMNSQRPRKKQKR